MGFNKSVSSKNSPRFSQINALIPANVDEQKSIEKKRMMSVIPNRRLSVISKIKPKIAFDEKVVKVDGT